MSTSNDLYPLTGTVVTSPFYDLVEVSFTHNGKERRVAIDKPDGYGAQHDLIGRHVSFRLVQCSVFVSELGFAVINPALWRTQQRPAGLFSGGYPGYLGLK